MEIVLKKGEMLTVSFKDTEQKFKIYEDENQVIINQTAGWEITLEEEIRDYISIYIGDRC